MRVSSYQNRTIETSNSMAHLLPVICVFHWSNAMYGSRVRGRLPVILMFFTFIC